MVDQKDRQEGVVVQVSVELYKTFDDPDSEGAGRNTNCDLLAA